MASSSRAIFIKKIANLHLIRPVERKALSRGACNICKTERHGARISTLLPGKLRSRLMFKADGKISVGKTRMNSTDGSWSRLIESVVQSSSSLGSITSEGSSLQKVRGQLQRALAARRSHEQGNLLPSVIASEFCRIYSSFEELDDKLSFFSLISSNLVADEEQISKAINFYKNAGSRGEAAVFKAVERLASSLEPAYKHLIKDIGHLEEGVKFLVNMRKDLLGLMKSDRAAASVPQLHAFERHLKQHLAQWFSAGFLNLERVTWNSPAALLEKVMAYEQVHPTTGWDDFKRRLNEDRRCFIFTHRLLPGEPLVILHTALGDHLRFNMEGIHTPPEINRTPDSVTSATFYTISSTQKGLSGIDLGNYLIKVVVQELKKEFPTLMNLGTLSPIPGFAKWLSQKLKTDPGNINHFLEKHGLLGEIISGEASADQISTLIKEIEGGNAQETTKMDSTKLQHCLMELCARYLYCEKRRGFALDPVANFHLRNGAIMWRLNWMADKSARGMNRSYGMMVNYKYDLAHIERNNKQYIIDGIIATSDSVYQLVK
ncbi:malonyl-CoA decarboxylase, mitochondrial-like [Rhopilema esculentum]|uniref:malonyl-CoA decarboxylase, mitochondrial-like n=1 Tax=Rhopilema esculentum TaxID=499914 RepID=UPI0031E2992A